MNRRVRFTDGLADELVVLAVCTDPEPMDTTRHWNTESAVVQAHANAVQFAIGHRLELERPVRWIGS